VTERSGETSVAAVSVTTSRQLDDAEKLSGTFRVVTASSENMAITNPTTARVPLLLRAAARRPVRKARELPQRAHDRGEEGRAARVARVGRHRAALIAPRLQEL